MKQRLEKKMNNKQQLWFDKLQQSNWFDGHEEDIVTDELLEQKTTQQYMRFLNQTMKREKHEESGIRPWNPNRNFNLFH